MIAQEQLLKDLINMQTSADWSEESGEIGEFELDNFGPPRGGQDPTAAMINLDPSNCINSPSLDQV